MDLLHTSTELKQKIQTFKSANQTIGFVPTMGALHHGHLSLVKQAKEKCDVVVVSIYVNPTQFNQASDLEKYPRTIEADAKLLAGYCDVIFNPIDNKEVYGEEIVLKEYDFEGLDSALEGAFRPGHFKGMANVVSQLFRLVEPTHAFFGLKDYQQYVLVKKMVEIDGFDIEIVGCSIIREESGLAMSSRNMRLTENGKKGAAVIHYAMNYCKQFYSYYSVEELKTRAVYMIDGILDVEYLEFRDAQTLQEINAFKKGQTIFLSFAGFIDEVRLIDNIRFEVI